MSIPLTEVIKPVITTTRKINTLINKAAAKNKQIPCELLGDDQVPQSPSLQESAKKI